MPTRVELVTVIWTRTSEREPQNDIIGIGVRRFREASVAKETLTAVPEPRNTDNRTRSKILSLSLSLSPSPSLSPSLTLSLSLRLDIIHLDIFGIILDGGQGRGSAGRVG